MFGFAGRIREVEAGGSIIINADGSISPPDGRILSLDNVTYTFNANINETVVVWRSNITVDGNGYVLNGSGTGLRYGVVLNVDNVTVKGMEIRGFEYGIYFEGTSFHNISDNIIAENVFQGIFTTTTNNNTISRNKIAGNSFTGIWMAESMYNVISQNNITGSGVGMLMYTTFQSRIFRNNITFADSGISLSLSSHDMIFENYFSDIQGDAIYITSSSYIEMAENILRNNKANIYMSFSSNNTVAGNTVADGANYGVGLSSSSNNIISANNITNVLNGIYLYSSKNNAIMQNRIANGGLAGAAIQLSQNSNDNSVLNNRVENNGYGVEINASSGNMIFHNNLLDNTQQAYMVRANYTNFWDNGVEGNYWSNYTGADVDNDGVGNDPHVIDANNTDRYPLMGMFSNFQATPESNVQTISNSTISIFTFNGTAVSFTVLGQDGTGGFCRITIPKALMNDPFQVLVNGTEVPYTLLPASNSTHNVLYFTYHHSAQDVVIIPELPSLIIILPTFMIATLFAAKVYVHRKHGMRTR